MESGIFFRADGRCDVHLFVKMETVTGNDYESIIRQLQQLVDCIECSTQLITYRQQLAITQCFTETWSRSAGYFNIKQADLY